MSEIHKALLKAQSNFEGAKKGAVNPQFRSKYADLTSVVEAVAGPLNDAGITYSWRTERTEHGWVVICTLTHAESSQSISCDWPIIASKQDAQGFASGSTYARRYSLLAVTGIPTEDDDGNAAVKSTTGQQRAAQVAAAKQAQPRPQVKPDTVAPGYPHRGDPDHGAPFPPAEPDWDGDYVPSRG
jgi:hypothetical protein